jgi:Polyketide cyclase / dehydrase and lipid transport
MSMWKKIGIGAAAFIVVLLLVIVTRPDTYHVERSATISAAPEVVYAHVADFNKWGAWSPWSKLDPKMKITYGGTQGTVGASYAWDSAVDDVGAGKMTITNVNPNKRIDIKLEFLKPFESTADNGFSFESAGKETKVTWFIDGKNDFMGKAMSLFMNMDTMIGDDFVKGLSDMKKVAEAPPAPAAAN